MHARQQLVDDAGQRRSHTEGEFIDSGEDASSCVAANAVEEDVFCRRSVLAGLEQIRMASGNGRFGAGRAIPNEKPEWPRSADSGRSPVMGRTSQADPTATLAALVRGVRYLIRQRTLGP
jgi:hypothetical protein